MAAQNRTGRTEFHTVTRTRSQASLPRKKDAKTCAVTAMVPARFLSEKTPEYAKGLIIRWGEMISFVDDNPFAL